MPNIQIKLPLGVWTYNELDRIGSPGGFGEVFKGFGDIGDVAIKRIKLSATDAANRELQINSRLMSRELKHVLGAYDCGQDSESDRYYLVMPLCECNLSDMITTISLTFAPFDIAQIVLQILNGLNEVNDIVHRDMKPQNVLKIDEVWKIADFGIAKFVQDSTSQNTFRNCLTPAYAAPEQWRSERPTTSTDVYSTGCIAYELFSGSPPFAGDIDDVRESHLSKVPAPLNITSSRLSAFISQMLRKVPKSRPSIERCITVFGNAFNEDRSDNTYHKLLSSAALQVASSEAEDENRRIIQRTQVEERNRLFIEAVINLKRIREELFSRLADESENVNVLLGGHLRFGFANATIASIIKSIAQDFPEGKKMQYSSVDVIGYSSASVECRNGPNSYTWAATLLFAQLRPEEEYRWYEVAFWSNKRHDTRSVPFSLSGIDHDLDVAMGDIIGTTNVAYGPLPIDAENEEDFFRRWTCLISKAAIDKLKRPSSMPITDLGFLER